MSRVTDRMTNLAVGSYSKGSISESMRAKRWKLFSERFPDIGEMHVLDVGGVARAWLLGGVRPAHLTLLNIGSTPDAPESWMTGVEGDACDPTLHLGTFDLVFSNSVIEHVGGHWRRRQYAALIDRSGPRHWVQTPNRYFPIEPHFLIPGAQFVPLPARSALLRNWPVGNYNHTDPVASLRSVMNIELLGRTAFQSYFPRSEIIGERVGPMTKSWIAVRG